MPHVAPGMSFKPGKTSPATIDMDPDVVTRQRRSSTSIRLVLIGAAAVMSGCEREIPARDVYANLESCRADWNQASDCEPNRNERYPSTYFYGPRYHASERWSGRLRQGPNALFAESEPLGSRGSSSGSSPSSSASNRNSSGDSSSTSAIRQSPHHSSARGGFGASSAAHGSAS